MDIGSNTAHIKQAEPCGTTRNSTDPMNQGRVDRLYIFILDPRKIILVTEKRKRNGNEQTTNTKKNI